MTVPTLIMAMVAVAISMVALALPTPAQAECVQQFSLWPGGPFGEL